MLVFDLGQTVMTKGVAIAVNEDKEFRKFVQESFKKYCEADWGDTC